MKEEKIVFIVTGFLGMFIFLFFITSDLLRANLGTLMVLFSIIGLCLVSNFLKR